MRSLLKSIAGFSIAAFIAAVQTAQAAMVITPTFTANFNTNFGANAAAAQAAWIAGAKAISDNFNDPIHINITVDGTAGTSPFGQSNTSGFLPTYAQLRTLMVADAKSADDATAIGLGGSISAVDPSGGAASWFVTRAQAKAIGLIPDDGANDGTTTFGAGNAFSFSGTPSGGFYQFQGIAAHEISEVMGRLGFKSAATHSLMDLFSYTGANTRDLVGGTNNNFSIDNGTTLLKLWNDPNVNGLDSRDWAGGTNDSFNQFSSPNVINPVTPVDVQLLDVIGYDLVPEPSGALVGLICLSAASLRRRKRA